MKIIDLTQEHENLYFCCLEDWSEEMKEAGEHKACWFREMRDKGLRVKLATDDNGTIGGMIQYVPIEHSHFEGSNLYVVLCIWVHGHKSGRGNFQKKGMGKALIQAAEEDVKALGSKGMVAWGLALPFFMRASWFKKQGYQVVDKESMERLLWKPFVSDAVPPKFIGKKKTPAKTPGKVTVSAFINGWCPAQNMAFERAKRAISNLEDKVIFNEYRTTNKDIQKEWGITDALFIDDKEVRTGPPPTYKKLRKLIEKKARKIKTLPQNI
ncbi:MAG TPA: GNAT family N-acetyltransferase [Bacteroidales bacterium]